MQPQLNVHPVQSGKLRRLITGSQEEGEYYRNYDLIKCRSDMQITLMNIRTDPSALMSLYGSAEVRRQQHLQRRFFYL